MKDVVVIGAGIVGLSTAWNLNRFAPHLKICVVEKESCAAAHQTGHNSGVMHSGIYYKPGSLKALNCIRGYEQLLVFCREHGIAHDVCGKIIVATKPAELPLLDGIFVRGNQNGLKGLRKIGPEAAREIEPHVQALEAIWVPQAGIIHYPDVANKYAELLQAAGGEVLYNHRVLRIREMPDAMAVETEQGTLEARLVINCAGLYSDRVAAMTGLHEPIKILPFRGEYYKLIPEREHLVRNLIYPVPNPNFPFLGVHFTRMVHGGIEAGPNAVLAFRREGYSRWQIHLGELAETLAFPGFRKIASKYWDDGWAEIKRSFSKALFVKALQTLVPEIRPEDVTRHGAGVRAMACDIHGNLIDDFLIVEKNRVIDVCNAPSPAATASLAIGETVAKKALAARGMH